MPNQDTIQETTNSTPPQNALAVTPSNTVDLLNFTRGIYVGVAGDVKVKMAGARGDEDVTFVGLAAGIIHPMVVKRIFATGTAATSIVAVF